VQGRRSYLTHRREVYDMNALIPYRWPALTALDRCERCPAAAQGRAVREGRDLLFCQHHLDRNGPTLIAQGFDILGAEGS
jgi:hypothetical protein